MVSARRQSDENRKRCNPFYRYFNSIRNRPSNSVMYARAAALGLSLAELAQDFDVDEEPDLRRLADVLAARPEECPRTRAALGARGLL